MKLFENKVGRPSNEIISSRKTFIISMITVIVAIVAVILGGISLNAVSPVKLKGIVKSDISIEEHVQDKSDLLEEDKWTSTYVFDKLNKEYKLKFTITNESNDKVYYNWITDKGHNGYKVAKVDRGYCSTVVNSNNSIKLSSNLNTSGGVGLKLSDDDTTRKGWLKLYKSIDDCKTDKKVFAKYTIIFKHKSVADKSNNNIFGSSIISLVVDVIKEIFEGIKNLFDIIKEAFKDFKWPWEKDEPIGGSEPDQPEEEPKGTATGKFSYPVKGITSCSDSDYPNYSNGDLHGGIDINSSLNNGNSVNGYEVVAADGGTIVKVENLTDSYGSHVIINHGNGYYTLYANMQNGSIIVKNGDKVDKGDKLGLVGNTGNTTGSHLHFEIRKNNKHDDTLNPCDYIGKDITYVDN